MCGVVYLCVVVLPSPTEPCRDGVPRTPVDSVCLISRTCVGAYTQLETYSSGQDPLTPLPLSKFRCVVDSWMTHAPSPRRQYG